MNKTLIALLFASSYLLSCGQASKSKATNESPNLKYDVASYIYSEYLLNDSTGKEIIIQNSFPKDGGELMEFKDT